MPRTGLYAPVGLPFTFLRFAMIASVAFAAKLEAMKLLSSLGELGTAAYVLGLAHIIDDRALSEAERRQMAILLREEIVLASHNGDSHRIATEALAEAYQRLGAMRSSTDLMNGQTSVRVEAIGQPGLMAGDEAGGRVY